MFNRSKATPGGRRLRATGGVPGMTEVLLLAAALFVILAPPYLSEAMDRVESQERRNAVDSTARTAGASAETANATCLIAARTSSATVASAR